MQKNDLTQGRVAARYIIRMYQELIAEGKEVHPGDSNKQLWYKLGEKQAYIDSLHALQLAKLIDDYNLTEKI